MIFSYNLTTTPATILIIRAFEVVTDPKKVGYNPLTTAYNPQTTYNRFLIVKYCNSS